MAKNNSNYFWPKQSAKAKLEANFFLAIEKQTHVCARVCQHMCAVCVSVRVCWQMCVILFFYSSNCKCRANILRAASSGGQMRQDCARCKAEKCRRGQRWRGRCAERAGKEIKSYVVQQKPTRLRQITSIPGAIMDKALSKFVKAKRMKCSSKYIYIYINWYFQSNIS